MEKWFTVRCRLLAPTMQAMVYVEVVHCELQAISSYHAGYGLWRSGSL